MVVSEAILKLLRNGVMDDSVEQIKVLVEFSRLTTLTMKPVLSRKR